MIRRIFLMILVIASLALVSAALAGEESTSEETYIVLYNRSAVPDNAAETMAEAGGALVYSYDAIGVAIARSADPGFGEAMRGAKGVRGAASTAAFGVQLQSDFELAEGLDTLAAAAATGGFDDPLTGLQWDMFQIAVPEAHMVSMGDPSVIVGDIDSGIDANHPDLAVNVDWSRSVSCIGGVPDQEYAAWEDNNFHGTHTAGTIAAAYNGVGIVGVAPDVKIAAIKGCNDSGYCWPEAIICSFMWAAENDINITNNSYYVDPYLFNCHNDAEQRAIWKAVQRAVRYAQRNDVLVVTSTGNSNDDLSHPDQTAGDDEINNACAVLPAELSGVIGVSANGDLELKSYYSSYGVSATDVVAPGGDARFQRTAAAPNGRVLSTIPTKFGVDYAWAQGTSMASPHAAGVAALILSQDLGMSQGALAAKLQNTADSLACPENPYNPGPPYAWPAWCQGGAHNSFYGHGQVNAYRAVTGDTGN
jgi:subtilisin family serine protease